MTNAHIKTVPDDTLRQLRQFDTCTISNAIEQFHVRTRNEGFVNGSVRCIFSELDAKAGYAVTARIGTSSTPIGGRCYYERTDWWSYVETVPTPRFIVLQDVDHAPGLGALVGEVHANIFVALSCAALLTNGAVRDLPGVRRTGLQIFAGSVAVSHAYAHVIDFGEPVEVGGLQIKPGCLLQGDRHGVVCIPIEVAEEVPRTAQKVLAAEKELIDFCQSKQFSSAGLSKKIRHVAERIGAPDREPV